MGRASMVAWSDLLQVVQVHGLQTPTVHGLQVVNVLQVGPMEGRKNSAGGSDARRGIRRWRGLYSMRGGCAGPWLRGASIGGAFVVLISCAVQLAAAAAGVLLSDLLQVARVGCVVSCASLAARRMICAGCRCKPSAAAAPVVYLLPLDDLRRASAAADDLKKTL